MIIYWFTQIYIFEEAKLLSEDEKKIYSKLVEEEKVPVSQLVAIGREAKVANPLRTAKRLIDLDLIQFDEAKENLQACLL